MDTLEPLYDGSDIFVDVLKRQVFRKEVFGRCCITSAVSVDFRNIRGVPNGILTD